MLRQGPVINHLKAILTKTESVQVPHTAGSIMLSNEVDKVAQPVLLIQKSTKNEVGSTSRRLAIIGTDKAYNSPEETWPTNPYTLEDQLATQVVNKGTVIAELKNRVHYVQNKSGDKSSIDQPQQTKLPELTATKAMLRLFLNKPDTEVDPESLKEIFQYKSENYKKKIEINETKEYQDFVATLLKVYDVEKQNRDKFVFYHGCAPYIGFYLDVIKEFREQLMQQSGGDIKLLRAFDDQFGAENVLAMLLEEGKLQNTDNFNRFDNYKGNFQNKGSSVNVSLVGSAGTSAECSLEYFYRGFSVADLSLEWLVKTLVEKLGNPASFVTYQEIYNRYFDKKDANNQPANNGKLLQIFISPSVVDDLCYLCFPVGATAFSAKADELEEKFKQFKPSKLLAELRQNPKEFLTNWEEKVEDSPEYGGGPNGSALKYTKLQCLQARLYLKPELFWNPEKVEIKSYWRREIDEAAYKKALKAQVQRDLAYWLKNREQIEDGKLFHGKIPLQEGYKLAYEQLHGAKSYAEGNPISKLPSIIEEDEVESFKRLMENPKVDLNKKIPTQDKEFLTPLEIAMKFNATKVIPFLVKQLLKSLSITDEQLSLKVFKKNNFCLTDMLPTGPTSPCPEQLRALGGLWTCGYC